jgi:predicted DNA binding CopG/RHH family protein
MRRPRRPIPPFQTETDERAFWETHDTTEFVDWRQGRVAVFPNLKPSTETISLRLPTALLSELRALANRRDVPYQSLLKVFLAERVARETGALANPAYLDSSVKKKNRRSVKPSRRATKA